MANDIALIKQNVAINDNRVICSTLPTGATTKRLIRGNYPVDLTIGEIQEKFDNRFDNPSYYHGGGGGSTDGGFYGENVLGV